MKQRAFQIEGQSLVTLKVFANHFVVMYGRQDFWCQTYSEAASQLGLCLMHAMSCNGLMDDNREFRK